MNRRQQQLLDVVDNLIAVHKEWTEDTHRPNPDATYWDAVDAVFAAFDHGDIPEACRPSWSAVEALRVAHDEFQTEADEANQYPGDPFWDAIDNLAKSRTVRPRTELPQLESVSELMKLPNMSKAQVCKMYGFVDANGNPIFSLVDQELAKPGSVTNNGTWKDPRLVAIEAEDQAIDGFHAQLLQKKNRDNADRDKPCPETPEQLYALPNMSAEQAAKMLKRPLGEVQKIFTQLEQQRDSERKIAVMELSREGMEAKDIAKELGMTTEAVKKTVLAAKAEEPEAATAGK